MQLYVAKQGENWLNDKYKTQVNLEGFQYIFPNAFYFYDVTIPDSHKDTLLYAEEIEFNFRSFSSDNNALSTGPVVLKNYQLNWLKHQGEDSTNLQKFIAKFSSNTPTDTSKAPFNLNMAKVILEQGVFHYENFNCENCRRFYMQDLNLQAEDFSLIGTELKAQINGIAFNDRYGLRVKNFSGDIAYLKDRIYVNDLNLITGLSELRGTVKLLYSDISDFKDFVNQVKLKVEIEYGYLSSADIKYFAPKFPNFKTFTLRGEVEGPINKLQAKDFDLSVGNSTRIRANLLLRDVTAPEDLYLQTPNLKLKTDPADIRFLASLFTDKALPELIDRLGMVTLSGAFKGYLNDFSAKSNVVSDLATFNSALKLKNANNTKSLEYDGTVNVTELDLGQLANNEKLGLLKANLTLKGVGIDPTTMNTKINGKIKQLHFNAYDYNSININGRIAQGEFKGKLNSNDKNLDFDFEGAASFGGDTSHYDFVMQVDTANLHELNLVEDSVSTFTGSLNIDFIALDYDKWRGTIDLTNFTYEDSRSAHFFQDVKIESKGLSNPKELLINSAILDATLKGDYTFSGIGQVFKNIFSRFNPKDTAAAVTVNENFSYELTLKKPEIITNILMPKLLIESGTRIIGAFSDSSQYLKVDLKSEGVRYAESTYKNIDLNFKSSQLNTELAFNLGQIVLPSGYIVDSIALDNYYVNDTLNYALTGILRDSIDSYAKLNGFALQKGNNSFVLGLDSSGFNVGKSDFTIVEGAKFFIDSSRYYIEDFEIANGPEHIYVNGAISANSNEVLRVQMRGFSVALLNYFLNNKKTRFAGNLQGDLIITEILDKPKFVADIGIDSLRLNKTDLGNLSVQSDYSLKNDTIAINSQLVLGSLKTMSAQGFYRTDSLGSLNFDLNFNRFRLAALNPIVDVVASNLRGMLTGNLNVSGTTKKPEVNGRLELPKVAFTITFLQSDYNLTNNPYIDISSNAISFPQLQLRDTRYGTKGTLGGKITHENFSDFNLDLAINMDELLVLNTLPTENDAYFGTAFATGKIEIIGPPDRLSVNARVETERNTSFSIPIGGATEVKRSNFVTFTSPKSELDTSALLSQPFDLDKGIALDFDIAVDQDAQVNIILNQSTGNKLNATGEGQIKLKINPNADMELFGIYTVAKGEYNFNVEGLLNKTFQVQRGGTVAWNGDPYSARLDITALYTTRADPKPFIGELSNGSTLTEVYLKIKGPLTDPDISFDIKTPRASSTVQAVLGNRLGIKENLNQQVFSLLAFNSFTPQSDILAGSSGGINQWDIIANQAAAYLNRFTGGYEVSLNYQQANGAGQNTSTAGTDNSELEVGVSKNFLDDRLSISSSVGVPLNDNQNTIAGDFEVTYSLTEDGRLRAKAFNRAVDNEFNISLGQQQLYQQGVGISYQVDFDNLSQLWKKVRGEDKPNANAKEEEKPRPKPASENQSSNK